MKKVIIICVLVIALIWGATYLKYLWEVKQRFSLNLNYIESTNTIQNPERGWYLIYRGMVNDHPDDGKSFDDNFIDQYNNGDSLALLMFNLQGYQNGDISKEGLAYIDHVLEGVKDAGLKAIVRFVYDWDGNGLENEPKDIHIILNHMEQLKSKFTTYQDEIYLVQGIFVGSYGEMHSSKYLDKENMSRLMKKVLECTPQSIKLSVRTPEYWRLICNIDEPISNLSQLPGARIGLYNDGLCSSETDLGTYSDGTGYVGKWSRMDEINFQSKLCRFVPNGGEIAINNEYNDLDKILEEFPLLHISYLNRDYNMDVLNKWKRETYSSTNPKDPYTNVDGYKYVQDHLGYRFVLRNVLVSKRIFLKRASTIELEIENTGFANMYYPKDVKAIFKGINTGQEVSVLINTDIRRWESGKITQLRIAIPKKLIEDTYKVYVEISDQYGNKVQLANSNIYDEHLGINAMGEIKIERLPLFNIW